MKPHFSSIDYIDLIEQNRQAGRKKPARSGIDAFECVLEEQIALGIREAFGAVYSDFGWDRLFGFKLDKPNRMVGELTMSRIIRQLCGQALSKVREFESPAFLPPNMNMVYRGMDMIDDAKIEGIRDQSRRWAKTPSQEPLTAFFIDDAALNFDFVAEDEPHGGSGKNGGRDSDQAMFVLIETQEGMPVGFDLFPGSAHDGAILANALDDLERRHSGSPIIVVADVATIGKETETVLRKCETPYILSAHLKPGPDSLNEKFSEPGGYVALSRDRLRGIAAWGLGQADPSELKARHRKLLEIDACFRIGDGESESLPAFHWNQHRIRAHTAICYMAFCCVQRLRILLARAGCDMRPDRILEALDGLRINILRQKGGGKKIAMPSSASDDAQQIYRVLGLEWNQRPFVHVS